MKKLSILILLTLITLFAKGQTVYPVRTYTVLTPPMPYSLSGFTSEPGRMQLNINVDDISLERYPVYFRLVIKGNGIKLHTKPSMYQEPFYLDGGMHEILTGFDLENLFNPQNLIFEGYSLKEYKRTGRLPEGVYQIYVELWDYYHKVNISQAMPGVAVMYLTRAPRLTFPMDKDEVDISTNPNLRFSWMGSMPNDPLTDPVYRFNLYQIQPAGRNPYEVVKVSPPVFTEDTKQPYLLYDMGMPPLREGVTYAWQVQSVDLEGRAKFQSDGFSEVHTFRYGKQCETPEVQISKVSTSEVSIKVLGKTNVQLYRIYYKSTDDEEWQITDSDVSGITISNLKDNAGYEIKVIALCGNEESDESNIVRFKTNLDIDYTCGKTPDNFDVSNTEPLAELNRFDFFKAADFSIEVVEAEGSNGRFTGSGFALIPYLSFVKFMVEFENIFINSDRHMTEGSVTFVYDESTGLVVGLDKLLKGNDDEETLVGDNEALNKSTDVQIEVEGEVTNLQINGTTVTVTTQDGKSETVKVEEGQTVGVVSKNGDTVYVADTGSGQVFTAPNPTKGGGAKTGSVGTAAQTGQYGVTAVFKPARNQHYGFDDVPKDKTKKPDGYFNTNKSDDKIAWKSLASGRTEYLDVEVKGSNDTLRYIRSSGMLAPNSKSNKGNQLLLTGLPDGEEEILTAASVKKEHINDSTTNEILTEAGAIGLVSYAPINKTVVLVPVNGAQCPSGAQAVKEALDKLYAPAVVNWNVLISNPFTSTKISNEGFNDISTNMFSKYTSNMNKVINEYKKSKNYNKENLYLFFVDDKQCKLQGFMPLTGQYGFIFNFGSNTSVLGHELGHGTFNLRHTFSDKAQHYFPERTTQNLMDYANGEELWKYQWDLIHDPEKITLALFQDEDEGAYETDVAVKGLTVNVIENLSKYGLENSPLSFITPTGQVITLPQEAYDFRFNREKGYLTGFSIGEVRYLSHNYKGKNEFAGYRVSLDKEDEPYSDPYSKSIDFTKGRKVFIAKSGQSESNCQVILEVGTVSNYKSEWDGLGGKKEAFAENIQEAYDVNTVEIHEQQFSPYNCAQQPFTKLIVGNLKHLVKSEEDKEKLLQILQILDGNYPVIQQEYSRYYNMDDYQQRWGDIEDFTNFAVSSNISLDDWLADFKEYEKEINYLLDKIKETSDEEKLRFYARFLTEGQTLLLEVEDRKKILQAYYNASSLDFFAEATIIKTLFYTPQEQLKGLLDELKQDDFKLLFSFHKEINDGFWITKDLHNFSYHKTIGYLIRKYHQLPEITPDNLANYFDRGEGGSKPIKAYYVLGEKLKEGMPNYYGTGDYYYAQLNGSEIKLSHYYCKEHERHKRANADKCVDGEYLMNGETFDPFDLVVLFKEGDVKFLDSETDDFGSLVVPAFVFHYLKREQAEQNAWEVAEASLIIASFAIPAGQIAVGLRVGGALGARIIALSSAELLSNVALIIANNDDFQKWCIEKYGEEKGAIIIGGANLLFSATSILTGASGGVQAMKAKDMLSTAATVQKLDEVISGAGKLEDVIPGFKAEDFVKVRMKLLEHVDEVARIRNLPSNINMLRIAYRYEDLVKIAADYPAYANQCKLLVGNGGDILLQGSKVTLTYNDEVIGTLDGSFKLVKTLGSGDDIADAVFDGFKLVKQGDEVGFMVADVTKKVHGVDFNYFYGSVAEFAEQPAEAHKAFYYYSKKDWGSLETLFKEKKLNKFKPDGSPEIYWPPANGGYNIKVVDINPGTLDRYQKIVKAENIVDGVPEYTGAYVSPQNNGKLTYASRALQGQEDSYDLYYEIKVLKQLPFKGEEATVIPWHGHVGNGLQLELKFPKNSDWTWKKLIDEGYVEIKPISSPSGKFEVLPNGRIILKSSTSKVESLDDFLKLSLTQKTANIEQAWLAYYPQIFFERRLFEDIMGQYRYTKSTGWGHTSDIASNFKAIDFYDDFTTVGNDIFANAAVSMKTTTTKSVDAWLGTNAVKSNIDNLKKAVGSGAGKGVTWNGKTIFYSKAEIHIYMPKENVTTTLKTEWLNKLAAEHPTIKFEINSLEGFVK